MWTFIIIELEGWLLAGLGLYLACRLLDTRAKPLHYAAYIAACYAVSIPLRLLHIERLQLLVTLALPCLVLRLLVKTGWQEAAMAALFTVQTVISGINGSVLGLLFTSLYPYVRALMDSMFWVWQALYVAADVAVVLWLSRWFRIEKKLADKHLRLLVLPMLFILMVANMIEGLYGDQTIIDYNLGRVTPQVNDLQMLAVHLVAYLTLIWILYAYQRLTRSYQLQTSNALYAQQLEQQRIYLQEANRRYDQTKAFRHDVKNHLLVLDGLMGSGRIEEARRYLGRMEETAQRLSFPVKTGRPVVDVLLGSKKLEAMGQSGVEVECALGPVPQTGIEDMDLCIVLANALDNAINACNEMGAEEAKRIRLSGARKGRLFILEVENTRPGGGQRPRPIWNGAGQYPHGGGKISGRCAGPGAGGPVSPERAFRPDGRRIGRGGE